MLFRNLFGEHEEEPELTSIRIAEADRMRSRCQELAAKRLTTFKELGEKPAGLEATKRMAERELTGLTNRRESIEKDRDALLESLSRYDAGSSD